MFEKLLEYAPARLDNAQAKLEGRTGVPDMDIPNTKMGPFAYLDWVVKLGKLGLLKSP